MADDDEQRQALALAFQEVRRDHPELFQLPVPVVDSISKAVQDLNSALGDASMALYHANAGRERELLDRIEELLEELLEERREQPPAAPDAPEQESFRSMLDYYEAMCDYYDQFEAPQGVKIAAFARKHGIDPNTFYKARHTLGRTKPISGK